MTFSANGVPGRNTCTPVNMASTSIGLTIRPRSDEVERDDGMGFPYSDTR